MTLRSLRAFLLITFGLAWGLLALLIFNPGHVADMLGPISGSHPLFILAVYSPAVAAILIVLNAGGLDGLKRFVSRLTLWRCSPLWYAFLLLGIPLIFYAGSAIKGNMLDSPFPFSGIGEMLGAMAFMLVLGPIEEFGWRGLALPLLQRHFTPFWSVLVLGSIWGFWHLPAFFLSGTAQSAWGFMPFFIGAIAVSLILTPLFNSARGSILLAALFHFQLNNPLWPDAQPYDTVFFVIAAVIIIVLNQQMMFTSRNAAIDVMPGSPADFIRTSARD